MKELIDIQNELKVLKDNSKNGIQYKYRTCDQIFQEVKPLCKIHGVLLTVSDEAVCLGDRYYIKATATVQKDGVSVSASGFAREPDKLMTMSYPQITGSCSSYARKTAMGGLFNLDDNHDPDSGEGEKGLEPLVTDFQLKELDDYCGVVDEKTKAWIKKYMHPQMLREDAEGMLKKLRLKK